MYADRCDLHHLFWNCNCPPAQSYMEFQMIANLALLGLVYGLGTMNFAAIVISLAIWAIFVGHGR